MMHQDARTSDQIDRQIGEAPRLPPIPIESNGNGNILNERPIAPYISFGPGQEHSFDELSPDLHEILDELSATSLEVRHVDGWDHIRVTLAAPVAYDVKKKIDEKVPNPGIQVAVLTQLIRSAMAQSEITYTGRLLPDGSVEAKDVRGLTVKTLIPFVGEIAPQSGIFHSSGEVELEATVRGRLFKKRLPLPEELASMARETIIHFDKLRRS